MCPNPLPPPVVVEPEPEPPVTIKPAPVVESSNVDYVIFIILCVVLSLTICGFCVGMLYKKNKKQENKVIPTTDEEGDIET